MVSKQVIFKTNEGISLNLLVDEDHIVGLSSTNPSKVMEALKKDLKSPNSLDREFASVHLDQISALGGIQKETSC